MAPAAVAAADMMRLLPRDADRQAVADVPAAVLVTGGTGFIGRHLVDRLTALGHRVRTVSRGDGLDILRDELPLDGIDHVFHLAARTGVDEAWRDPPAFLHTNGYGTARVLDQCRRRGCSLTFLSSYLYGDRPEGTARETDPVEASNPYALSKHVGEQVCAFYAQRFDMRVVTLRCANVYGPGQRADFLIPWVVAQVLDDRAAEIVVRDLAPERDYLHVADAVDGMLLSAHAAPGAIFNLGSGVACSVEEIIRRAGAAAGISKPYRASGAGCAKVRRAVVDTTAIRTALGWEPRVDIDAGLRSVVASMRR